MQSRLRIQDIQKQTDELWRLWEKSRLPDKDAWFAAIERNYVAMERLREQPLPRYELVRQERQKREQMWRQRMRKQEQQKRVIVMLVIVALLAWLAIFTSGCQTVRGLASDSGSFCNWVQESIPAADSVKKETVYVPVQSEQGTGESNGN